MPNTDIPITNSTKAEDYRAEITKNSKSDNFEILIPCYLTENLDLDDFKQGLKKMFSLVQNFILLMQQQIPH